MFVCTHKPTNGQVTSYSDRDAPKRVEKMSVRQLSTSRPSRARGRKRRDRRTGGHELTDDSGGFEGRLLAVEETLVLIERKLGIERPRFVAVVMPDAPEDAFDEAQRMMLEEGSVEDSCDGLQNATRAQKLEQADGRGDRRGSANRRGRATPASSAASSRASLAAGPRVTETGHSWPLRIEPGRPPPTQSSKRNPVLAVVQDEHLPVASSGEASLARERADEHE
jgi:hypothetical protein